MTPFITGGAGFLLAVLWLGLMFDIQALRHHGRELPEDALASIAGYYHRVTTTARPMNRLVAAVMLATVGAITAQIVRGDRPRWVGWVSVVLAGAAILLAARRTVPAAVRLGARTDPSKHQSELAKSIGRDHVFCAAAIVAVLASSCRSPDGQSPAHARNRSNGRASGGRIGTFLLARRGSDVARAVGE